MSVRIGIDFRAALAHPCGIARYSRELARGLLELRQDIDLVLYGATRFGSVADRIPRAIREHPRAHIIERRLPAKALRALSLLPGFRLSRITGPLALLHHTDLTYLPAQGIPEVVTVHDLAYEVSAEFHGKEFRAEVGNRVRQAVERACLILVPSESTRRDLVARYGVAEHRMRLIPHGVDHVLRGIEDTDTADRYIFNSRAFARPYLLHVGTIEPRKNLVRVVHAFEEIRRRGLEVNLILAGPRGWLTESFDAALAAAPHRADIYQMGAVPEQTLRELYRRAALLVYPSLYEGYGLPVVEAMALGIPVVTSNRSSTAEIAADAACLVDPEDTSAIVEAVEGILRNPDLRQKLGDQGRRRTRGLTWKHAADATFEAYREVLRGSVERPYPQIRTATA